MAKATKKRDKKYVPRPVYYPGVMIQLHSFDEFEKAFDAFLIHGEVEIDHEGTMVYKNSAGIVQSYASTIYVYTMMMYIYGQRNNVSYDLQPLSVLQSRMYERRGFDEEEIEAGKHSLEICREILKKTKPSEIRDIMSVIKASWRVEDITDAKVSDYEITLGQMVCRIGNIGEDLVIERHQEYQALALEHPDDEHILKIRDDYSKFVAAYRFRRIEEARMKGL